MRIAERDPALLIAEKMLQPCGAIEGVGETGRLGYRITEKFVSRYFGRVFADPAALFTEEMLRPELQDRAAFEDGLANIVETQRGVAQLYFDDGSIEDACPPPEALLHIMVRGQFNGHKLASPEIRRLFDADSFLESDWYRARLEAKAKVDARLYGRLLKSLDAFAAKEIYAGGHERLQIAERRCFVRRELAEAQDPAYIERLKGTLGMDPAVA